jgi:hypothetical protein
MPQEELLIAVTGSARARQILLSHGRHGIARHLNLMNGTVARAARRCVRIACRSGLSVNTLPEVFYFIGVALRTFCRRRLCRSRNFVGVAVAGLAGYVPERAMNAVSHMRSLVGVASRTLNLRHFVGMWKIFNGRVAVLAAQSAVDAGRMLRGFNRDAFAGGRSHSRLAVTGKAAFILLQWMGRFRLGANPSRHQRAN